MHHLKQIEDYIDELASCLKATSNEEISWSKSMGRVLFESLASERDSPALDVSSMDGYAMRCCDLHLSRIPIALTIAAGEPPRSLPTGTCAKIFTGAAVPEYAELVVRREDVHEADDWISIDPSFRGQPGDSIRRRGENALQGSAILEEGHAITQARLSGIIASGKSTVQVHRRVRLAIINTGDELVELGSPIEPWQIRDSNGPTLEFFFRTLPWAAIQKRIRVPDSLSEIRNQIASVLPEVDAVLLTGGVSMGGADHVPQAVRDVGGKIVFHRIPIRPGKPILGAATDEGKLILGLPGNPVSVAVTSMRFGLPLLRRLAGFASISSRATKVTISKADSKTIPLVWYRLAKWDEDGAVKLVDTHGSGDLISLANSDGVVEIPANDCGPGPFPWYPWTNI